MNNGVLNAMENYLDSSDDLAFQVNGGWGTGKTYFIQHDFLDLIKQRKLDKKQANTLVYFSLNGLSSITDLKTALNRSVLVTYRAEKGDKSNIAGKLGKGLEVVAEAKIPFVEDALSAGVNTALQGMRDYFLKKDNFREYVIVFDDLERIAAGLTVVEVFGYIADLQNKWHCKIIVVSDEQQLIEGKLDLNKRREKVINKSIHFGNDTSNIAYGLIEDKLGKIFPTNPNILTEIKKYLKELLTREADINLRTLKSFLDTFEQFNVAISENDMADEVRHQCLITGSISLCFNGCF